MNDPSPNGTSNTRANYSAVSNFPDHLALLLPLPPRFTRAKWLPGRAGAICICSATQTHPSSFYMTEGGRSPAFNIDRLTLTAQEPTWDPFTS